ncbi:peptidoglycan DD-metalloendopeptidase family protein [Saccharospirillum mangrovi]|uniref:peptidoglycan DD-metalloendopeptidase family protein n=1 Tax=Saccharospirillum mangrovi TaxID=2161747 RepID=UPI0013004954|nr:peptidoglycan DD-metalloendopeptidase family protein [Saccharospirillum mangrovi]
MLLLTLWPATSESVIVEIPARVQLQSSPQSGDSFDSLSLVAAEVRAGDTLSTLFERAGAGVSVLYRMLANEEINHALGRIYPGQSFNFGFNSAEELKEVTFSESQMIQHRITLVDDGFQIEQIVREPEIHTRFTQGTIETSLYLAGKDAGLSDNMIMELATLFGWDIDFVLDIRVGDSFSLIYEEHFLDGKKLSDGPILAARFTNQGRDVTAIRYSDAGGRTDYYSPNGDSIRKAFLRTPLDVFRISSGFNMNRRHPVLNTIRAHRGTDYAAPTGTPIKVTGDGKVISVRRSSSYGNVVVVQHGGGMRTLYAHMSQFSRYARVGNRVNQGQIIGYVGSTGLATGPHLHYEFLVNGVHRNPQTVPLPTAQPLAAEYLPAFQDFASNMMGQLDVFNGNYAQINND